MIENRQQGNLPALVCEAVGLPPDSNVTLTELACYKIYGAPLTKEKLNHHQQALMRDCRAVWSHPDGPVWLREHFELMAKKQHWQFKPSCSPEDREHALAWFAKARRWLQEMRMQPAPEDASNEVRETKSRLANLSESDAIQMALEAANQLEAAEAAINERSAHFYSVLSNEVATGRVVLKGIPVGAKDGQIMPPKWGEPPHKAIPQDYFNLPFEHDLYNNELAVKCCSSEEEIFHSIFNRTQQQFVESLVRYQAVRVPPEGVQRLLAALSGASKPGVESPPKQRKRAGRVTPFPNDTKLVAEMEEGRDNKRYTTRFGAATALSAKAEGSENSDSKARRLDRKYKEAYPDSPWNN
jgi:hypothetical protein